MFHFTIRDVLWLTVVVALGVWLAITSRRLASLEGGFKGLYREFQALERQHDMLLARDLSQPVGGEFLVLPPPSLAPLPSIPAQPRPDAAGSDSTTPAIPPDLHPSGSFKPIPSTDNRR
jgi:hypothetical protein